jgi:hypothetical protein
MTVLEPLVEPLTAIGDATGSATVLGTMAIALLTPIGAATLVLTWHGLRGTDPGPAARMLLRLVELLVRRRRGQ